MALADVDRILEGLKLLHTYQTNKNILAQQQAEEADRVEQQTKDRDLRQKALQETIKQHQSETALHQANLDMLKAAHKATALEIQSRVAKSYMQGEAPMPGGFEKIGERQTPEGETYERFTVPSFLGEQENTPEEDEANRRDFGPNTPHSTTPYTIEPLSPPDYQKRAQSYNEALEVPKRETARILQGEIEKRNVAVEKLRETSAQELRKLMLQSQSQIAAGHNSTLLEIARMREGENTDFDPSLYIKEGIKGNMSLNDLKKALPKKNQFSVVENGILGAGAIPLDDKQKNIRAGFVPAVNAIGLIREFVDLQRQNMLTGKVPLTPSNSQLKQIQGEIEDNLLSSTKILGITGVSSRYRGETMDKAFSPSLYAYPDTNERKATELEKLIGDVLEANLKNLSQGQRDHIKGSLYVRVQAPTGEIRLVSPREAAAYVAKGAKVLE